MRLYYALLVAAVTLLANNVSAGATDYAMSLGEDCNPAREIRAKQGAAPMDGMNQACRLIFSVTELIYLLYKRVYAIQGPFRHPSAARVHDQRISDTESATDGGADRH
ncbi:unnamed protein product [Peronospora destructor]|uniref:Uncharacterized protein n=1 Tax=Peronospora destructor TaxID=86335 RepID=A0AAV0U9P8_9STRA|nr:unnamed protein product [Peronospora destructor]